MATSLTTSTNEMVVDLFTERAVDLLRLEAGTRDKVVLLLHDLERDLLGAISASGDLSERKRLERLLKIVQASIQGTYRDVSTLMTREIREVIDIEATWTAQTINTAIGVDFVDGGLTRGALKTLVSDMLIQGAASEDWWGRQAAGLADRFADEMRRGVALGESNAKLVERVRAANIIEVSQSAAERLVRASVQAAANTGREAMYTENNDIIASLQWHATLDARTSVYCITRDGHHYTNDDDHKPKDNGPPWLEGPGKLHWGCRSTSVPVLKTWRELGIDEDDIPQTTRASMDGQVPAQQSFEQWLRKQSEERQDAVLGKAKADLWRAGKIKFRDLLDQKGRPLTTEQLREKAARK